MNSAKRIAMWFFFTFVITLLLVIMTSCAGHLRVVEKPVLVPQVTRCADSASPAWVPVPPPTVCVRGHICYKTPDAAELADNIDRLRQWAKKIDALCAGEVE